MVEMRITIIRVIVICLENIFIDSFMVFGLAEGIIAIIKINTNIFFLFLVFVFSFGDKEEA